MLTSLSASLKGLGYPSSAILIVGLLLLLGFFSARLKKNSKPNLTFIPILPTISQRLGIPLRHNLQFKETEP